MRTAIHSADRSFYGWHVVAAVFVLAVFGWGGGFYGPPVFLFEVVAHQRWTVQIVSGAVTLHFLLGAFAVTNMPRIYRRIGVARATVGGALLLAVGELGWALAHQHWQLFLSAAVSGIGWAAMGAVTVNALIAPWVVRKRPAALGIAYYGAKPICF